VLVVHGPLILLVSILRDKLYATADGTTSGRPSEQPPGRREATVELPEHVLRNRAYWDRTAPEWIAPGERNWAKSEPTWGVWGIPEAELHLIDDVAGLEAFIGPDLDASVVVYCLGEGMSVPAGDALVAAGVPAPDAAIVAEVLIESDRRGIDSHGIGRLKPIYIDRIRDGILNPVTHVEVIRDRKTVTVLDGHNGMGHVVAKQAMETAIAKAKAHGMGMTAVRNSTHYGIAGYYALMATKAGMIGITGTNARPSIAPTFGVENMLGTKFINIAMGRSRIAVQPDGEVKSEPSAEIQDLVKKGFGIFDAAQAILGRIDKIIGLIESGQGSIGKFLVDEEFYSRLVKTVAELQKVSETIGSGKGTVGRLLYDESLYNEAHETVARLDQVIQDLQAGQGTAGQLLKNPELYKDAQASIAQVRQLLDDLNAGKGTAGKLLKDEVAYKQIQSILGQVDTTLGRINAGQGTVGQLLANPQLYDSMRGLSTELQGLVGDVRKNPKKFLRVKFSIF